MVDFCTHARLLMGDWQALRQVIEAFSQPSRDQAVLTDQQIEDALQGPASGFVGLLMSAYAKLSQARFEVNIREDMTFIEEKKTATPSKNKKLSVRDQLLSTLKMNDVRKIQQSLDEWTLKALQQWQNAAAHWGSNVQKKFESEHFALSPSESDALKKIVSKSEITGRFQDLNIALPKIKTIAENFSDYFYLKLYLVIQSHLSLHHQPHADENIVPLLKDMKKTFEQITKEEGYLIHAEKKQVQEILKPLESL